MALTLEEFLPKARQLNPDYTDEEHIQAYEQRYGRSKPVQTVSAAPLTTYEEFLPKARALNPDYSDDEHYAAWQEKYGARGAREKEQGDAWRGVETAFKQIPQTVRGLEAGAGAIGEKIAGEGGLFTALKEHGLKGYQEHAADIAKDSKPSDSVTEAYKMAKAGDAGALVDWLQYALGYGGGQALQMLATAGIGYAGGKLALQPAARALADKMIAKESARLAATGMAGEQLAKQAVSNVAGKIGQTAALAGTAVSMEGGEIYGGLVEKAAQEGRSLTGEELARATGATLSAGALEFVGDKIGLDLILGKSVAGKLVSSRLGHATAAGSLGVATEGGTEFTQTLIEEFGKGNDPLAPESIKQAVDAAALGGVGGGAVGTVGGIIRRPEGDGELEVTDRTPPDRIALPAPPIYGEGPVYTPTGPVEEVVPGKGRLAGLGKTLETYEGEVFPPTGPKRLEAPIQPGEYRDGTVYGEGPIVDVSPLPDVSPVLNASSLDDAIANAVGVVRGATETGKARAAEFARMTAKAKNETDALLAKAPEKRAAFDVPTLPGPETQPATLLNQPSPIVPGQAFTPRVEPVDDPRARLAEERARMVAQRERQRMQQPVNPVSEPVAPAPAVEAAETPLPSRIDLAYPSSKQVRDLIHEKGLHLDTPVFREILKQTVKKEKFADLTPQELQTLAEAVQKIKAPQQPTPLQEAPPQVPLMPPEEKPYAPVTTIPEAQVPRSELPPEKNAEMLLRAEKAKADMEIAGTERGGRFFHEQAGAGSTQEVTGLKSATADWYRELTSSPSPAIRGDRKQSAREKIEAAIPKPKPTEKLSQSIQKAEKAPPGGWGEADRVSPEEPFSLSSPEVSKPKAKEQGPEQLSIDVPPPTVGERPIIGREATLDEAPLFSKNAQEKDPEQISLDRATISPMATDRGPGSSGTAQTPPEPGRVSPAPIVTEDDIGLTNYRMEDSPSGYGKRAVFDSTGKVPEEPGYLYHVSPLDQFTSILRDGLRAGKKSDLQKWEDGQDYFRGKLFASSDLSGIGAVIDSASGVDAWALFRFKDDGKWQKGLEDDLVKNRGKVAPRDMEVWTGTAWSPLLPNASSPQQGGLSVTPTETALSEPIEKPDDTPVIPKQDSGSSAQSIAPEITPAQLGTAQSAESAQSPTEILATALRTAADRIEGKQAAPAEGPLPKQSRQKANEKVKQERGLANATPAGPQFEERNAERAEPTMAQFEQAFKEGVTITGTNQKIIDSSQEFPKEMIKALSTKRYVRQLTAELGKVFNSMKRVLMQSDPETFRPVTFAALSPDSYYYGVNLRGPDQMILNPWTTLHQVQQGVQEGFIGEDEVPEYLAGNLIKTLVHEFTHQQVTTTHQDERQPYFLAAEQRNRAILGSRLAMMQRQLMAVLTGGTNGTVEGIRADLTQQQAFWEKGDGLSAMDQSVSPEPSYARRRQGVSGEGASGRTGPPTYLRSGGESETLPLDESPGLQRSRTVTDSPAFKAWFNDSKVVDENGKPLVVYHGTASEFDAFSRKYLGSVTETSDAKTGFWFSANPDRANLAAQDAQSVTDNDTGANVMPVYLRINNPYIAYESVYESLSDPAASAKIIRRAKRDGHDGVIFPNGEGGENYVVFKAEQIKSATGNRGTFDPKDARIQFSKREPEAGTIDPTEVRDRLAAVKTGTRPYLLGALGLEQLSQVYGNDHAEVRRYNKATQAMEADFTEMSRESDAVARAWTDLKIPVADKMAKVMEDARFLNFDPDPRKKQDADSAKKQELRTRFEQLPDEAQAVYRMARDFYTNMAEQRFQALKERIERAGGTPENTRKLVDRLQIAYEQVRSKVYFPFTRFGENIVVAKKMENGVEKDREVHAFESVAEAQKFATMMKLKGWQVKQTVAREYSVDKEGPASKIVRQMHDIIKELGQGQQGLPGVLNLEDQLLDALNQSFLQALPDMSYAKHFIHAKDVKGASRDALRSFAHSALHGAHHISRIRHADQVTKALLDLDTKINETVEGDTTEARQVYNELTKRHNDIMNPNTHPFSAWLGQLGFTMSLGGVVATGITNATQVPLVTYPWLGARYGFGKASAALARAYKDFLDPRTLNKDSLFDATKSKLISESERKMLLELARRGHIDLTQTMDLAGLSSRDNLSRKARTLGTVGEKVTRMLGFTFHAPEVMNRQVTALSTFRLEKEKGSGFEEALERAQQAIQDTHFIYQCVDTETECMTPSGWKRYDELQVGETIYGTDENGALIETTIEAVNTHRGEHKVLSMVNQDGFSMVVTENHRCVTQLRDNRLKKWLKPRLTEARDLQYFHTLLRSPLGARLEREAVYEDDFVSLLAWVVAEGSYRKTNKSTVTISQSIAHNPARVAEIEALLNRLGGHYRRYDVFDKRRPDYHGINFVLRRPLSYAVREALPDKMITPEFMAKLTVDQMRLFVETFGKGDGYRISGLRITQKDRGTLDMLQVMATITGNTSYVSQVKHGRHMWHVLYICSTTKRSYVKCLKPERIVVDTVWCPTTTCGTWIARRGGRTFVTGNSHNRPRYMQGNFLRVLTQFKQYSQNIAYTYGRAASIWLDRNIPANDEEGQRQRQIAKRQLLSMLVLQFGAAGALGMPFFGTPIDLLMAVVAAMGDDDEKRDWEVALRQWLDGQATSLAEAFIDDKEQARAVGKELAEVVAHGASRLTPFDMASRLGQNDLFFREPQREREGRQAVMDWGLALGGPVPSYFLNALLGIGDVAKGMSELNAGFFMRGVEELTPAVLRHGVRSLRYTLEGVRTRDEYKQLDLTTSEKLGQAFGFQPARVAEMYESTTAVKNKEHRILNEQKDLKNRFARAVDDQDDNAKQRILEDIRGFNERNPMFAITSNTLNRSLKARRQHEAGMERGMYLPPRRRALLEEGDFGDF